MNFIASWFRCVPEFPEPDHVQTHPRWVFQHGSVVYACSYTSAIRKLEHVQTERYWASETCDGVWDVQFDTDVFVENVRGFSVDEVVDLARYYVVCDAYDPNVDCMS